MNSLGALETDMADFSVLHGPIMISNLLAADEVVHLRLGVRD